MGNYGKGIMNSSGRKLLETCKRYDLTITNTLFKHKMCHRTTWIAPFRNFVTKTGENRRNPVRNQIDYIIVRNSHRRFVTNSRSYGGIETETDHKLVKMELRVEWYKLKSKELKKDNIDISNFTNKDKKEEFQKLIVKEIEKVKEQTTAQGKWDKMREISKETGKKVFGVKTRQSEHKDEELQTLSLKAKKLRKDAEACEDSETRLLKNEEAKKTKIAIKRKIKEIEEKKLEEKLNVIENSKDDSTRYYKAIKEITRNKKIEHLCVKDKEGKIAAT